MGKASRDKGARGEREIVSLIPGAKRIPLSGAMDGYGNDVELPNGWKAEVKRRAKMEATLYSWLMDEREQPDCVAFRGDRMPWVVCMTLDKFLELMKGE